MRGDESGRRGFLRAGFVAGLASTAGCLRLTQRESSSTPERTSQDTDGDGVIDSEDYAPRDPDVQREAQVGGGPTATETTTETQILFSDDFEDGDYSDTWAFGRDNEPDDDTVRESDGRLVHESAFSYNNGATLLTDQAFTAEGRRRLETRMRTRTTDYWGYGFGFQFGDTSVKVKEHKWESYDRLALGRVSDRPSEYASDYRDNPNTAKLAPATTSTDFLGYSITVDFDAGEILEVTRGDEVFDLSLPMEAFGSSYSIKIGDGRGHKVEFESIALREL